MNKESKLIDIPWGPNTTECHFQFPSLYFCVLKAAYFHSHSHMKTIKVFISPNIND